MADGANAGSSKGFGFVQLCVAVHAAFPAFVPIVRGFLFASASAYDVDAHIFFSFFSACREDAVEAVKQRNGMRVEGRPLQASRVRTRAWD